MSWSTATLGEVCQFVRNGKSIQQSKEVDGLPITRIETIADQSIDEFRVGYAGISAADAEGYLLEAGDILFSHINSVEHLGKVAIYEGNPEKLVHGMNLLNLRPDGAKICSRYLLYVLRTRETKAKLLRIANKSVNQASIAAGNLKKVEIPVPPLGEQRRIAAILDKVDALRAKRREAIAKLDQLLQSVFLDMFGDPGANSLGWTMVPFTEVGEWKSGGTPPKSESSYWNGVVPWVSPKDMKVDHINDAKDRITDLAVSETGLKRLKPGHLLIVVRGMILAHSFPTAVNNVSITINQDMKAIEPNPDFHVVYLKAAVDALRPRILNAVSSAGHGTKRLASIDASGILVPKPPMELQVKFGDVVTALNSTRVKAVEHLDLAQQFFGVLQDRAFSGTL